MLFLHFDIITGYFYINKITESILQKDGLGGVMTKNGKKGNYPSLYDDFELGDRVKRVYKDKTGRNKEYRGIVLAIDEKGIEIYWDTRDGKYRPNDMEMAFTNCPVNEIYQGNDKYSPIEKDTH